MRKGFASYNDLQQDLNHLTPSNILQVEKPPTTTELNAEEVESLSTTFMAPIQLWSMKVNAETFKLGLRQLVRYSYGIPRDTVCIESWKHLSFAFLKHHEFIWPIIEECTDIMKTQVKHLKEAILFLRINPMLILQTIPKEVYDVVGLPKSYIDLLHNKLQAISIRTQDIKIQNDTTHRQICIQLVDELLQRSLEPKYLEDDLENPIEFSISLLGKILCK
ncbi:MAG: hypothetical protein EXX96DRAFT_542824 [Benjaminiella poitrasii]|nr:MAG: hypothetical protein EXX96DRAFT_542824 [Benjaminiella poitrasii]